VEKNRDTGRVSGLARGGHAHGAHRALPRRRPTILLATEAAAEGVNLQFCSLVVNYDLPWNPQRIEQRIGRCHRYGQKHDVVVINFLNERNEADRACSNCSREVQAVQRRLRRLGRGARQHRVRRRLREAHPRHLPGMPHARGDRRGIPQAAGGDGRADPHALDDTRRKLFEHFDEDVHQRLRLQLADAKAQLDRVGKRFWSLTRFMLDGRAASTTMRWPSISTSRRATTSPGALPPDLEVASPRPTKTAATSAASSSIGSRIRWASTWWTGAKALHAPDRTASSST
jgi:superfamily II DNA/RNA helicase